MKIIQRHKWIFIWILILVLLVAAAGFTCRSYYQSKYSLTCSSYVLYTDKLDSSIRMLQITDLHNSVFGENNRELIDLTARQSPDLILITGDLLNSDDENIKTAADLIADLCGIAPVYVSLGNHELEYRQNFDVDITAVYENAGAVVLERQYEDIEVNGQKIRLGGIYGYCLPAKYLETDEADSEECEFLTDFQSTGLYTILMCHIPVCWMINDGLDEWKVDCVVSGHLHGGQVILPFIGGIYAPDMGLFPGKLKGVFYSEDSGRALVLSGGLGTTEEIPRLNNIPEIVTIDIEPESAVCPD